MAFDLASARPASATSGGFDLASARPVASAGAPPADADAPEAVGFPKSAAAAFFEPLAAMGTGMLAKPASDIAGLAALGKEATVGGGGDPAGFAREVQQNLTYAPRTAIGQAMTDYNPLALLGRGIGWLGDKAGELVAPPSAGPVQAAAGSGVAEAVKQAPGFLGIGAPPVGAAAASALKGAPNAGGFTARGMMQSALKPTLKSLQTGKAAAGIDTLLDEGVNVTRGGAESLQGRIDALNDTIAEAIQNSAATVDKAAVATRLQSALDRFRKQVTPLDDVKAIQKAWDEFMNHPDLPKITPGVPERTVASSILDERGKPFETTVPAVPPSGTNQFAVQKAQQLKQGTYRALGDKSYGELKGADIEAQKTLARGLKEEIADAVPAVRPLNAEESRLLNALSVVERRVLMEANKNPVGLGWLTTSPTKFAAWMADRSGLFKSIVARMLNTGSEAATGLGAMGPPIGFAVGQQASDQLRAPPP